MNQSQPPFNPPANKHLFFPDTPCIMMIIHRIYTLNRLHIFMILYEVGGHILHILQYMDSYLHTGWSMGSKHICFGGTGLSRCWCCPVCPCLRRSCAWSSVCLGYLMNQESTLTVSGNDQFSESTSPVFHTSCAESLGIKASHPCGTRW